MSPRKSSSDRQRTDINTENGINRRRFITASGGLGTILLAGCSTRNGTATGDGENDAASSSGEDGSGNSVDDGTSDDGGTATDSDMESDTTSGRFQLLISDRPVAIDEFDSLDVSFDRARIFRGENTDRDEDNDTPPPITTGTETTTQPGTETQTETETTTVTETDTETESKEDDESDESGQRGFFVIDLADATVDLTQVVGKKASGVFEGELPKGRYTKIELYATGVESIVDGEPVDVMIPSGKLQITKPFEVKAGETLSFVFDITVVKKGKTGEYNLLPVISESGVAGKDVKVKTVKNRTGSDTTETEETETEEGDNDGSADGAGRDGEEESGPPDENGPPGDGNEDS